MNDSRQLLDEAVWLCVRPHLLQGAVLWMAPGMRRFCVLLQNRDLIGPSASPTAIARWESEGRIRRVGRNQYALTSSRPSQP